MRANGFEKVQFRASLDARLDAGGHFGPVHLVFCGVDGQVPPVAQIYGDSDLLEHAWDAGSCRLAMAGVSVRVAVHNITEAGALSVSSAPVLRTLAALAKRPANPPSLTRTGRR